VGLWGDGCGDNGARRADLTIDLGVTSFTSFVRNAVAGAAVVMALSGLALADSITGTVTNKTTNKPSAGDDVTLIRLEQGMQEQTHAKTDAKGNFKLDVPEQGLHLVRVTHDKANYFRPAPAGTESVEVDVYNAADKVEGITGEADMMRIETDESGKNLRVVENFFVKNDSNPQMTQAGDRPFEFYLPASAVVLGGAAMAPGGMQVQVTPVKLDEPNHFAFSFPLRPGESRFQISYTLPYTGKLTLAQRPSLATGAVLVMMPKSMKFTPDASVTYMPVTEDTTAQTYVLRDAAAKQTLGFTVAGTGQLPRDTQAAEGQGGDQGGGAGAAPAGSAAADTRPGGGLGTPLDPEGNNDPWAKYKWWIIGGLGLALAAGAGFLLKDGGASTPRTEAIAVPVTTIAAAPVTGEAALLAALKDELFALETDRLQGRLSEAEFVEQKAALEVVLRRALARVGEPAARV
jgi:hypothetical protein